MTHSAFPTHTDQIARLQNHTHTQNHILTLAQSDLTHLKDWILQDNPATVHHLLTTLCETIIFNPKTMKMKVRFR